MLNRISRYDAKAWLTLLVQSKLINYGEPVVATHEAMANWPEVCVLDDDEQDDVSE